MPHKEILELDILIKICEHNVTFMDFLIYHRLIPESHYHDLETRNSQRNIFTSDNSIWYGLHVKCSPQVCMLNACFQLVVTGVWLWRLYLVPCPFFSLAFLFTRRSRSCFATCWGHHHILLKCMGPSDSKLTPLKSCANKVFVTCFCYIFDTIMIKIICVKQDLPLTGRRKGIHLLKW